MRFLMPIGFLAMVAGFSAVVMMLWNWLMPSILGLVAINFWQALGLLVLARILFSGFGHGRRMGHWGMHGKKMHGGNAVREKWAKMTPEEREEFIKERQAYMRRGRFGGHDFFGECNGKKNPNNSAESSNG